jgi:imidazoleglycerol-phosphate dehydratase
MQRSARATRKTRETNVEMAFVLDGKGQAQIATGIGFFDHMLTLFTVHGGFDLRIRAQGDIDVDYHHTVEDVGLVLGDVLNKALGNREGIRRFGHSVTPMDESLAAVTVDLSKRPYLVCHLPVPLGSGARFDGSLAKEFFRALATRSAMNLHINVSYGENEHHIIEAVFKAAGRSLAQAAALDDRFSGVRSSKGAL